MATYTTLKNGSRGDDVKQLQNSLINAGYNLTGGADGVYGSYTANAVKQYQKANGLIVDGIAGNQTLSHLYGSQTSSDNGATNNTNSPTSGAETNAEASKPVNYGEIASQLAYDPSKDTAYNNALSALQAAQQQKPTYAGKYDQQLDAIYNKIMGREDFKYDINSDALYNQYKQQYVQQGQQAMQNAMGQAATMTGGYGNSYAATAGNQAYQAYIQQLNDKVPELYDRARSNYDADTQRMLQQYSVTGDMADTEYGRYQDDLNQYMQQLSQLRQDEQLAYNRGYDAFNDAYKYGYTADRDAVSDMQYQQAFEYQQLRDQEADRQWGKEYELALKKEGLSGSGGVSSSSSTGYKYSGGSSGSSSSGSSSSGSTGSFTGSTYDSAVSYIRANGGSNVGGMLTQDQWTRQKAIYSQTGQGGAAVANYSSYAAYLKQYVKYATGK